MGNLYRSEEMQLVRLFVQREAARDTVDEIGKLGLIQFRDLNPEVSAFQRNFVGEVKKCDEMERKVRLFNDYLEKERKEILLDRKEIGQDEAAILQSESKPEPSKQRLDELEVELDNLEKELTQMYSNQTVLNKNYNELNELKHVLQKKIRISFLKLQIQVTTFPFQLKDKV